MLSNKLKLKSNCMFSVGNMIDKKRTVPKKDAMEAASRLGVDYIEASSLENIKIDTVSAVIN